MPAQPFSAESLAWLRKELLGKNVTVQPYAKDRYERVVSLRGICCTIIVSAPTP